MVEAEAQNDDSDDMEQGPLRTCAVTRRQEPIDALIRFVAAPDGTIVPDLAARLPGRGVWILHSRETLEQAVRTRAFSRSLKREVTAAADLPETVDRLLARRALEALSLANKAGLVATGFTKIDSCINAGTTNVLLHATEAGDDGVEKLDRRFRAMSRDLGRPPKILRIFKNEQMSLALGRSNVVHAALTMGGAAMFFLKQAERLERYRTGMQEVA